MKYLYSIFVLSIWNLSFEIFRLIFWNIVFWIIYNLNSKKEIRSIFLNGLKRNFVMEHAIWTFKMYRTFRLCWANKFAAILDSTFYLWLFDQKSIYFPFKFAALSTALWKKPMRFKLELLAFPSLQISEF